MLRKGFEIGGCRVRCALGVLLLLGLAAQAHAGPRKVKECKASKPPNLFANDGEPGYLTGLQFNEETWGVRLDRPDRPKSIRLLSLSGQAIDLSKPPPTRPVQFVSRGRAVYAVGTSRSRTEGKVDLVLLRWGDPGRRPKLVKLWTVDGVTDGPVARVVEETLAVAWGDKTGASGSRVAVGFVDLERMDVSEKRAVGASGARVRARLLEQEKGFAVAGSVAGDKAASVLARFDRRGRPLGEANDLALPDGHELFAAADCQGTLFALSGQSEGKKASLHKIGGDGSPEELNVFAGVLDPAGAQLSCARGSAVVGYRQFRDKVGSIVFWIATVAANGKVKERRIKDMKGAPQDLTSVRLVSDGDALSAWWIQKESGRSSVVARPLACR